jgi:D-sedoheptulose 7-phosphate isomerase
VQKKGESFTFLSMSSTQSEANFYSKSSTAHGVARRQTVHGLRTDNKSEQAVSFDAVCSYFVALHRLLNGFAVTDETGAAIAPKEGIARAGAALRRVGEAGRTVFIVGNGGSAGIASQVAYHFTHTRSMRILTLADGPSLTGISVDDGYQEVFARQIAAHGDWGDYLIAISSSGQSRNILNAIAAARGRSFGIFTMSGFKVDNPVRRTGDLNFFIGSSDYGFVEIAHLALCHAILDCLGT